MESSTFLTRSSSASRSSFASATQCASMPVSAADSLFCYYHERAHIKRDRIPLWWDKYRPSYCHNEGSLASALESSVRYLRADTTTTSKSKSASHCSLQRQDGAHFCEIAAAFNIVIGCF
jgi:hypothetical protein